MATAKQIVCIQYNSSPCGELILGSLNNTLCLCDWRNMPCANRNKQRLVRLLNAEFAEELTPVLEKAKLQLNQYFAGRRRVFDVPLLLVGTDFQQRVWNALQHIPYGQTLSYKEVAQSIGNAQGIRAVAQAIGANGISIFIPCHRVIGSNHSLTGFAGGLDAKEKLLKIEGSEM